MIQDLPTVTKNLKCYEKNTPNTELWKNDRRYKFLFGLDLLFLPLKKNFLNEILKWDTELKVGNLNLNTFFYLCLWFPSGFVPPD